MLSSFSGVTITSLRDGDKQTPSPFLFSRREGLLKPIGLTGATRSRKLRRPGCGLIHGKAGARVSYHSWRQLGPKIVGADSGQLPGSSWGGASCVGAVRSACCYWACLCCCQSADSGAAPAAGWARRQERSPPPGLRENEKQEVCSRCKTEPTSADMFRMRAG